MTDEQKKMAGIAVTSLVFGILGFTCLGPLGAIPAIICGHIAKSKIKDSAGTLQGDGIALAGLILGYVCLAFMIVMIPILAGIGLPAVVKARDAGQRMACVSNMRLIDMAKQQADIDHNYGEGGTVPEQEISSNIVNGIESLKCPKGGIYTINPIGQEPDCSVHGSLSAAMQ